MKGYTLAGKFSREKDARRRADSLRHPVGPKFKSVIVKKGTCGVAWGNPRTCWRVWVK